jgi:hypothetical protein
MRYSTPCRYIWVWIVRCHEVKSLGINTLRMAKRNYLGGLQEIEDDRLIGRKLPPRNLLIFLAKDAASY